MSAVTYPAGEAPTQFTGDGEADFALLCEAVRAFGIGPESVGLVLQKTLDLSWRPFPEPSRGVDTVVTNIVQWAQGQLLI